MKKIHNKDYDTLFPKPSRKHSNIKHKPGIDLLNKQKHEILLGKMILFP